MLLVGPVFCFCTVASASLSPRVAVLVVVVVVGVVVVLHAQHAANLQIRRRYNVQDGEMISSYIMSAVLRDS